uniref:Uncharacterized protein n=1 Tax=Ciona intestinalis TaxID=7719 RepID=H2Y2N9_CIOIN
SSFFCYGGAASSNDVATSAIITKHDVTNKLQRKLTKRPKGCFINSQTHYIVACGFFERRRMVSNPRTHKARRSRNVKDDDVSSNRILQHQTSWQKYGPSN